MFLKIVGAHSAKQSGINGGKIPFDPNIISINVLLRKPVHIDMHRLFKCHSYYSFTTLGYTETCFLSLPFLSNLTTPSTKANKVSSPPRPTLTPG